VGMLTWRSVVLLVLFCEQLRAFRSTVRLAKMEQRRRLNKAAFCAAVLATIAAVETTQTRRALPYRTLPGEARNEPSIARKIIRRHLDGPERQFYDLFRKLVRGRCNLAGALYFSEWSAVI
jgi:hypothetical protein